MQNSNIQPISVGLASFGMSGLVFHAPLISTNPGFRLSKIVERSTEKSRERFPQATIVRSFEELIADPELELIVVNTPNALHLDMARRALEAGKHVIVEKPMTVTAAEAQTLIDLARSRNLMLSVFQNRRWDGDFQTLQRVVQNGLLGQIVEFEGHYDRFRNYIEANTWKEESGPGAGILYNLGSHMIDQALALFGKPEAVSGEVGIQRPGGQVDDFYHLTLHYPSLRVVLKSSYLVREAGPRYILHGTQGSFIKYGLDPQEEALKAAHLPTGPTWGAEQPDTWGTLNTEVGGLHFSGRIETIAGNYPYFYQNIYQVIREGKDLAVKPEESMLGLAIIEAAIQSNQEKRTIPLN
ncbi:MAG: oxidoreductase [Adhaeribacter sp.]